MLSVSSSGPFYADTYSAVIALNFTVLRLNLEKLFLYRIALKYQLSSILLRGEKENAFNSSQREYLVIPFRFCSAVP